jgi:hypothetical protein
MKAQTASLANSLHRGRRFLFQVSPTLPARSIAPLSRLTLPPNNPPLARNYPCFPAPDGLSCYPDMRNLASEKLNPRQPRFRSTFLPFPGTCPETSLSLRMSETSDRSSLAELAKLVESPVQVLGSYARTVTETEHCAYSSVSPGRENLVNKNQNKNMDKEFSITFRQAVTLKHCMAVIQRVRHAYALVKQKVEDETDIPLTDKEWEKLEETLQD